MSTICGANCDLCSLRETCRGCAETCGRPFGGACLAAESIKAGGNERFAEQKRQLISQFNALGIEGMPEITELFCLCGSFVNLAYPMPNGRQVQLLDDKNIYLGTQVEGAGEDRCFGLVGGTDFLLVCTYGEGGTDPQLVMYRKTC